MKKKHVMKITSKKAIVIIALLIVAGIVIKTAMYLSELQSYVSSRNAPAVIMLMPGVDTSEPPYFLVLVVILIVAALAVILYEKFKKR